MCARASSFSGKAETLQCPRGLNGRYERACHTLSYPSRGELSRTFAHFYGLSHTRRPQSADASNVRTFRRSFCTPLPYQGSFSPDETYSKKAKKKIKKLCIQLLPTRSTVSGWDNGGVVLEYGQLVNVFIWSDIQNRVTRISLYSPSLVKGDHFENSFFFVVSLNRI